MNRSSIVLAATLVASFVLVDRPLADDPPAPRIAGTWEWTERGVTVELVLGPDGSGTLLGEPIVYRVERDRLAIVQAGEEIRYSFALEGDRLVLSGGGLDGPMTFARRAPAGPASGIAGNWEHRHARGVLRMRVEAGGAGELNGQPFTWRLDGTRFVMAVEGGSIEYAVEVGPETLRLAGGDLQEPVVLRRVAADPPAPAEKEGLAGTWRGEEGTLEIRADGTYVSGGRTGRYTVRGDTITAETEDGVLEFTYRLEGDRLTLTAADGQAATYTRGAASKVEARGVEGVWVCQEASLDPSFYLSFTQYVILYPGGAVGYQKAEGAASRTAVDEHLERFSRHASGREGDPERVAGRWESDGRTIVIRWNQWNGLVSRGQVDLASGRLTLSGMGVLEEGATLTFERGR